MLFFLMLEVVAIGVATVASLEARWWIGIGAVALMLYLAVAVGLSSIPPYVELPLGGALGSVWWLFPAATTLVSVSTTFMCFRTAGKEREGTRRHGLLERSSMAFLGNALLDLAMLLIVAVAHVVASDT